MSDSESDFYETSPPAKRRRLSRPSGDHGSNDENDTPASKTRTKTSRRSSTSGIATKLEQKQPKLQKPKHRVHVQSTETIEIIDVEASQLPDGPPSSPWRVRGAIWKKPQASEHTTSLNSLPMRVSPAKPHASYRAAPQANDQRTQFDAGQHGSATRFDEDELDLDDIEDLSNSPVAQARLDALQQPQLEQPPTRNSAQVDVEAELANLPSDAFDSSPPSSPGVRNVQREPQDEPILISSASASASVVQSRSKAQTNSRQVNFMQMTLHGERAAREETATQPNPRRAFIADARQEKPTHHELNTEALSTYTYPTNLGTFRQYQFNIVQTALQHNTLVALPTGLGKTFIAATVMLNWYRWTKSAQIVFVAPTRPLVAQQVEACFKVAGIPKSETSMLTGGIAPGLRAEEWTNKRIFFMTPQTITNDLKTGICDPKRLCLLVVDEAHRATGGYAYVEVVKIIRQFNPSFRILALTATPGNSVEAVQNVINGLDIAQVEIRTELSLDIREYVHSRNTDRKIFDTSEEMSLIMEFFSNALRPLVDKLRQLSAYSQFGDPMSLTAFGLTKARQQWASSPAGRNANAAVKGMVTRLFMVLASLAHSIDLLKYHGLGPFYHNMVSFQNADNGRKHGKYEQDILQSEPFMKMMSRLRMWINDERFIGHPKLEYLQELILDHFQRSEEEQSGAANEHSTRVMIFAHFRDSAEEIVRVLSRNSPMIRPHVFVGQAASKGSEGMDQKRQLEVIQNFKSGQFNTLVATSIGEEGLDIGEVDLIVCYDSSSSPIRMLQRMGRTGRKRAGNIVLLLMRGKEENSFAAAKDNYLKMQSLIAKGDSFSFHQDRSPRILPFGCKPAADKREVEIPVENTQAGLPEPKKRGRAPKRPPKKFHMPDGVRTGFVNASRLGDEDDNDQNEGAMLRRPRHPRTKLPVFKVIHAPDTEDVLLTPAEERELTKNYKDVAEGVNDIVQAPNIRFDDRQLSLRPTKFIGHSSSSRRLVNLLCKVRDIGFSQTIPFNDGTGSSRIEDDFEHVALVQEAGGDSNNDVDEVDVSTTANAAKRKPNQRAKRQNTKQSKRTDAAVEAASSSPEPTPANMALPSQGISLGSADTSGEEEDEAQEYAGSDLADFIDDGDEDGERFPMLTSSPPYQKPKQARNFWGLHSSSSEGESDHSVPDIRAALNKQTGTIHGQAGEGRSGQRAKRRVLNDSDSE